MKNNILNYSTLILIMAVIPMLIWIYFRSGAPVNVYSYIGLALMIPSLILFAMARIKLGSSFQVSAEANNLVTTGVYKKLRHPIYLFGTIFLLGAIIFIQKFILLIVLGAMILMQLKRIKKEEQVLEEKFGEQYLNYKKGTWF
jgi:protein-S-isoprenylcysteine O-methyltransferase Ste14